MGNQVVYMSFLCCCFSSNKSSTNSYEPIHEPVGKVNSSNTKQLITDKAKECFRNAMQFRAEENPQAALKQFIEAHKNGHPNAMKEVYAEFYVLGMDFKAKGNFEEAFGMFEEAAEGLKGPKIDGHANAQCELAMCYMAGKGVEKNQDKARIWFNHAIARGHHLAPQLLNIMDSKGNPVVSIKAGDLGKVDIQIH